MLVEVKYNPFATRPFSVHKKTSTGWVKMGEYTDALPAKAAAKQVSELPDIPCCIAKFENGVQVNANEV